MAFVRTNDRGDIVAEEGYSLAPFLLRLSSAAIDAAFLLAGFWLLFFFSYSCTWYPTLREGLGISAAADTLYSYQKASCLLVIGEDGSLSDLHPSSYDEYEKAIYDYYFVYNAIDNPVNPAPHGYTIDEYNTAVCDLPKDVSIRNDSAYYNFATDAQGDPLLGQPAVLKPELFDDQGELLGSAKEALLSFYRTKYYATQDILRGESYYKAAEDAIFYPLAGIEIGCAMIPFLVFYVLIPVLSPYNRTLGKKFLHLAVIDVKGEPLKKYFLALRSVPFVLTLVIAVFLNEVVYSLGLALLVFLVSWGCASFTKRKRALHDYCAHSVVAREDELYLPLTKEEAKPNDENHPA